jgi:hypothetical protein
MHGLGCCTTGKKFLPDQINKNEMGGEFRTYGERRGAYGDFLGKPEGTRPLGRRRLRWEDNIKIYLQHVGWKTVAWIGLAEDRDRRLAVVNTVMNIRLHKMRIIS